MRLTRNWSITTPKIREKMSDIVDPFDTDSSGIVDPFAPGYKPPEKQSAIGYGIGQIKAGVLGDLPEMVGKAMQYTSKPGTNGDIYGQKLRAYGEERQAANPVDESQGGVTRGIAKGARAVSAFAPALVGGIAGHFLAPEVAIPADVAIGAGMGGATGGAQGQDTLEKARTAGLSEDQALSLSHKTALTTSVGMFGVNALTAGLGGPLARSVFGTGVKTAEDAVVNAAAPSAIKRFAQDTAVSTLGNEAAMTSTAAANAEIEQDAGLKGPTPGEAAWQAAKDAAAFSLVHAPFGGLHTALAVRDAKVARDQLTNADTDPEIRAQHARQIFANINQVDPEAAQNFANNAQEAIKNQDPLVLDENVIKPSAGASPVAADESQPLSLVPIDQPESATPEQDQRLVPVSKRESPAQDTEAAQQPDPRLIPVSERNAQPVDQVEAPAGPLSAAADIGRESGAVQMRTAEQDGAQSPIEGALESAASGDKTAEGGSPDRRQDVATRKTVSEMSSDERAKALLTSDLTGLPNKRAYDEHIQENPDQHTLYGDVDDFKSLNSSYGHNGADQILKAIGDVKSQVAKEMGVNAFHRSGDEFLATHEDPATLESYGKAVQDRLAGLTVEVTNPDGKVSEHTGVGFSYGIGKNDKLAELKSDRQKSERKALGLRTGERDADAVPEQPAGGQQDIKGVFQGPEGTAEEVKPSAPVDQRLIPVSKRSPAKEAENVTTPIETKQAETQGPQPAADAAVGKEVSRYSSRQTDADGNPKSGSGMDAFNAKQFAGVLNRAHPEMQHVPVERDNGRFDVVGREKAKDSRLIPVSKREAAAPVEPTTGKPKSSGQRMRDKLEADDPFRSFLAKNGVHPDDKADTGIEAKQRTMVPGYGPIFRKSAPRLDELAAKAHEAGFLSKADIDNDSDNGGTRKLADMIQRSIGNAEVIQRASHEGVKASQSADDQLLQHAHELGIETDGKTADKVYDEVVQHHADDIEAKLEDSDIPFDENDPRLKQETLSDDEIDKLFGAPEASSRQTEGARSEDAGGRGAGTGESQDFSRKSESAGEVNQFSLSSETADQARARIDTAAKRQADEISRR
jgi:GGDEF domain-containing protein